MRIGNLKPSEELSYWVGVMQSDGYFEKYTDCYKKTRYNARVVVSPESSSMLIKFKRISKKIFKRDSKIFRMRTTNKISFKIGIGQFLKELAVLDIKFGDPPKPPKWTLECPNLFGAYLAGIVDVDGNIRMTFNKTKNYFQCFIRIFSAHPQDELAQAIEQNLNCKVYQDFDEETNIIEGRKVRGKTYYLQFCVSTKNWKFFNKFVKSHLTLEHKCNTLNKYLKIVEASGRPRIPLLSQSTP